MPMPIALPCMRQVAYLRNAEITYICYNHKGVSQRFVVGVKLEVCVSFSLQSKNIFLFSVEMSLVLDV
jgi:hypothetical protein